MRNFIPRNLLKQFTSRIEGVQAREIVPDSQREKQRDDDAERKKETRDKSSPPLLHIHTCTGVARKATLYRYVEREATKTNGRANERLLMGGL